MGKNKYNAQERKVFKRGFFAGLFKAKKKSSSAKNKQMGSKKKSARKFDKKELLEMSERYRTRNLGALLFDGKIYDTNFKGKPSEITKDELKDLRSEYDSSGKASDIEVADRFVRHMRRKYGVFDRKTGNFLHMIGEDKE